METLGHIKSIRLFNIQSWGDSKDTKLNLSQDKVNVIVARNETGKSVLFKVFRQMCFPNFFGRTGRKDLIKRGKDEGMALITLATGETIVFEIHKTYQLYRLFNCDNEEVEVWRDDTLPKVLEEKLGWYVDREFNILLNVIDLEMPAPFIESSLKFNARVLKFVVQNEEMENSIVSYRQWLLELKELEKEQIRQLELLKARQGVFVKVDTDVLKSNINVQKKLISMLEFVEPLKDALELLDEVHNTEPKELEFKNHDEIEETFKAWEEIGNLLAVIEEIPTEPKTELNESAIVEVEELLETQHEFTKLGWLIKEVVDNIKPKDFRIVDEEEVKTVIKNSDIMYSLMKSVEETHLTASKLASSKFYANKAYQDLKELEQELGVCPMCGCEFEKEGGHVHAHEQ